MLVTFRISDVIYFTHYITIYLPQISMTLIITSVFVNLIKPKTMAYGVHYDFPRYVMSTPMIIAAIITRASVGPQSASSIRDSFPWYVVFME